MKPPRQHRHRSTLASERDAVKEEHDLRPFAQHRQSDGKGERPKRPRAASHVLAESVGAAGKFAPMPAHPDIVPAEHADGSEENAGVEQLLANALGRGGDRRREDRHQDRSDYSGGDAARHPQSTPQRTAARRQDDADDQRRFEYLAEDDNRGGEHRRAVLFRYQMAAGAAVEIVEKLIAARIKWSNVDSDLPAGGDDLFAMQALALEFRRLLLLVLDQELDLHPRRNGNLARHELVVFEGDDDGRLGGESRQGSQEEQRKTEDEAAHRKTVLRK